MNKQSQMAICLLALLVLINPITAQATSGEEPGMPAEVAAAAEQGQSQEQGQPQAQTQEQGQLQEQTQTQGQAQTQGQTQTQTQGQAQQAAKVDKLKEAETTITETHLKKEGEAELECTYIANESYAQIKNIIKNIDLNAQSSASENFKKFANVVKASSDVSIFKPGAFCAHVAPNTASSRAKKAGACRNMHPFNFALNEDCKALGRFLSSPKYSNVSSPFTEMRSKKIKDTDSTCVAEGSITLDYEPCVKFAKAMTLWKAGQLVIDQGQQAWMMGETQSAMADAQGKADDPKAALGAMKVGAEAQSTVVKQKAALESAKLAHLISLYKKIPNEDIFENLEKGDKLKLAHPPYGILLNQDVKDDFKGELVKVGGTAAAQMIMAKIADDRVDAIGNAMARVDSFKPVDFNVAQEDAMVSYCQQHPEEPKCLSGELSYNVDPFSGDVIQFGNSGTGTTYSNIYTEENGKNNAVTPTGSKNKNTLGPIGTTIAGVNKDNDIVDKSNSATLGDLVNPQGGGGGGGGPAGGGGFGGGGGAPGGQKPGDSVTAAGTGSKVSYTGGGGVSVLGNGLGIANRKSGKDDENPFGDLLNKNKGNGNSVLNLRGPASVGKKDGNIFEQISTRYREVSSNKERLLEYQQLP